MNIPMKKVLLPQTGLADAKPLLGFDMPDGMYHVLLFDFGDDGGAIGIFKEGDDFIARISLNDLAAFNRMAKGEQLTTTETAQ
jgi:hypothetical protein